MTKCSKCGNKMRGKANTFCICKECHAKGWKIERIEIHGKLTLDYKNIPLFTMKIK